MSGDLLRDILLPALQNPVLERLDDQAIVEDLRRGVSTATISRRFHNGLVETLSRLACLLREESSLNQICLSGGTFNNQILCEQLTRSLTSRGFAVFAHSQVPAGDGGLSLGQALVAAHSVSS